MSGSGEKKNSDKLNMVGIATVGFAGSAVVYLSIIGIQALYLNETSSVNEVAQFGKQGEVKNTLKAEQLGKISGATNEVRTGSKAPNGTQLYSIPIDAAMKLVVRDAANDPANLVPAISRSEFATIKPAFGRPQTLATPQPLGHSAPPPPPVVDPSAPAPTTPEGTPPPAGAAPAPATPAAAPATTPLVPAAGNPR
jgi:hypothetical protein